MTITTGPCWLTKDNLIEMCNDAIGEREQAAPIQARYHLPFGGSMSSRDRLNERRFKRLKNKKVARKDLKEQILNGQDPYG